MGFKEDKQTILAALLSGSYLHEPRMFQAEKNWLSTGDLTKEQALEVLSKVVGREAEFSLHHFDANLKVWVFKPEWGNQRWYIKCYMDDGTLTFISFHPSGGLS